MRVKAFYRHNGIVPKVLSRIVWHPAWQNGYPVRLRVSTNAKQPTFRFNGRWLDVRLPPEEGRHISTLARIVRQLRNGRRAKPLLSKRRPLEAKAVQVQTDIATKPQPKNESKPKQKSTAKPKRQRESPALPSLVNAVCSRCQRNWLLPPEWLKLGIVRCGTCGSFLREGQNEAEKEGC